MNSLFEQFSAGGGFDGRPILPLGNPLRSDQIGTNFASLVDQCMSQPAIRIRTGGSRFAVEVDYGGAQAAEKVYNGRAQVPGLTRAP